MTLIDKELSRPGVLFWPSDLLIFRYRAQSSAKRRNVRLGLIKRCQLQLFVFT